MIAALLLFASGAAALVFQVVWVKQLTLVVGVEVYAVSLTISGFFAGLAAGSWLFGRWVDGSIRPWRLYALLEVGIASAGVLTTLALAHASSVFAAVESRVGLAGWLGLFVLVGIPALFMGGTVPAVLCARRPVEGEVSRSGGRLYAANTTGAIVGTLLTPFVLVPVFGVRGAGLAAAALNLAVAGVALSADRRATRGVALPAAARGGRIPAKARTALLLYSLAGGLALGYEVVWSQAVAQFSSTRVFAFAVMLATYLTGLAVGSALLARSADRVRDPWRVFALLVAAAGVVAALSLLLAASGDWLTELQGQAGAWILAATGSELARECVRYSLAAAVLVLPSTLLLGAAFPAAVRLAGDAGHVGRDVGAVLALNTLGGIGGTLVVGFLVVPWLGLTRAMGVLALAATLLGLAAMRHGPRRSRLGTVTALTLAVVAVLLTVLVPADLLGRKLAHDRGGELVFYREAAGATVAVLEQQASHDSFRRLYIQGVSNSGDAMTSLRYMRLQALLPLLVHGGEPRSALVIGLGTGITCGALLRYPDLDRRLCVELLPAVVEAVDRFAGNYDVASDPRVEIRIGDGRQALSRGSERFDLITLEPPPPSAAGVVNLYSRDFYRLARSRLDRGGLVAQWWPLPTQNDEDSRALVRSFLDVFPHVTLWTTEVHEMMLVGSAEPIVLDAPRITERLLQPEVSSALAGVGIDSPAALLATWITDRPGLERYAAGAAAVTDDRPRIEYAGWVREGELLRVLPQVLALRGTPPLQGADPALTGAVEVEADLLRTFYEARLDALRRDRAAFTLHLRRVLDEAGGNPYFRWVAGLP